MGDNKSIVHLAIFREDQEPLIQTWEVDGWNLDLDQDFYRMVEDSGKLIPRELRITFTATRYEKI